MNLIKFDQIVIPDNRQRREFENKELVDLGTSILSKGLMHALVVRNDGKTLVAGERRLKTITQLYLDGDTFTYAGERIPRNMIPVVKLGDLDDIDVREAELEENTKRVDLTWQEKAKAIAELHELRLARNPQQTKSETIHEAAGEKKGSALTNTRDSLILAEHLDNPEVAKARTQKDAIKVVRKIKQAEHRSKLSKEFDLSRTKHTVELGDMQELIKLLPDNSIDLIVTDPPYGMGADTFGDMASTGHNYDDSRENAEILYKCLANEGYRVCKEQAHLYAFCRFEDFDRLSATFELAGWRVWQRPLIWDKGNGMLPRPKHGPKYTYECIIFANKGEKETLRVANDIIRVSSDMDIKHGAQKPVALYTDLITRSCLPGAEVLDPFGGSGTILGACTNLSCRAIMYELDRTSYDIAIERLQQLEDVVIDL